MDFHSLTRKELQTLCKMNKIPANITNVAMADALKSLEIVEGLDEIMKQSQSPEKSMNKSSQEVPSTVCRTSTPRQTTKEEPQSTQPTTRTRRTTTRIMELNEENKNVNVPETPVMATTTRRRAQKTEPEVKEQKKSDLVETPALQSGRRRPEVGSTRRKVEVQKEGSVPQGYGTRRSVRLLEKCMSGLNLKESERMEPLKIDERMENEVEENKNGLSGATSEVPLSRNLSAFLEDERDLKDDVLEKSKCDNGENDCTVISEADSHKSDGNLDSLSALDAKDPSLNETTDEEEGEDKLADSSDGIIDPKGSDDFAVSEDLYDIVNLNEELVADETDDVAVSEDSYEILNLNEESIVDETKSIDVMVADASEDISKEVLDHSSSAEFMEPVEALSVEEHADHTPQEIECQNFDGKDCDINVVMHLHHVNHDLAKLPEPEVCDVGQVSQNASVLPEGLDYSSEKLGNEESENDPDQIVTRSNTVDVFLGDSDIDDDTESDNKSLADEVSNTVHASLGGSDIDDDTGSDNNSLSDEVLVDVNIAEDEMIHVSSFHNAPQSVMADIPVHKMLDYGDAEALVNVCVNQAEEFAETAQEIPPKEKSPTSAKLMSPPSLISNSAIITSIPLSPLTAQFPQPTRSTPRKSSSKKQTIPKMAQASDNNNKENIGNNYSANEVVEPCLGKVKKNKNIINEETMQKLEGMSLRNLKKLTKMLDKLQINDNMKNEEEKNDLSKQLIGKSRQALQTTLPQNCMSSGEAEEQN